ncbi:508_t:CDS:2 [Paraglomus brasilianum]|uniref:508_t:CDS:1 n=1 Tax=Paraglomus brasilianum TaxID=144538 RepID=A0A9N9F0T0_9GLOM|nr:508_t:CDS:2 [Paraglomus brasilianum]
MSRKTSGKTSGKTNVNTESVTIFADPGTSTQQRGEGRLVVQNEYDDCAKQERVTDIGIKGKPPTKRKRGRPAGTNSTRIMWTAAEDKLLIEAILSHMGTPPWTEVSKKVPNRNANACLIRWKTLQKRLISE